MDEEKLINLVRSHECIYDVSSRFYMDQHMKRNAWQKIAEEMNTTHEECQKAWSCLRNNYRKALKNRVSKSGDAAKKRRPIKFEKELEFLQKFFQDRPQLSNLDSSSDDTQLSEDTQNIENTQPPNIASTVNFPEAQSPVSQMSCSSHASDSRPARHVRQRSYMSSQTQYTETTAEILKKYIENQKKEQHPMEIFFQAMAATAKTLSPKLQAEIKRDVLRIVTDAEIKHLENVELSSVVQRSRPSTSSSGFDISNEFHSSQQYAPTSVARTHNTTIERRNPLHNFSSFNKPEQQYNSEPNYGTTHIEYIPTPISRHQNNSDIYDNNSNIQLPDYEN
ncbi:uncharacterized protein LOC123718134 [Pieris brassicae]|uniref:MADF domain-containing protein n=1 Tax=Pieris brassicae TaxID=7116 RepID=A0A9P0TM70_PIEBR|nr:uncharacterized protein LOC123712310 [Pieris brassicae]XP_045524739.1 uncharacterized protein LOC123714510 [Pieris brassicae]XP_045528621.1 uncharacterized protein LOC123716767 [Pieris brassicae]XP_045528622.1 uncharacterized protein LOC123716768 [Pieris brassicae]XP_045528901.1 uncharacterized protein LOC123717126 [Pieris brassicae]XP_045530032.1 uncharacterized protein LOC123717837 [Pieris brassicae]XP_045530499.1 uncharacterized protein LOC123718134 [Pieris brassicae]CAH4029591.1 unnam